MGDPLTISKIISQVQDGVIRIPGFQRKFVWEPQQAALLMDSIFKGYPFGSILLWRTRTKLKTEKRLGGFALPDPEEQYPIDYVLDGQQRITSLFATFQVNVAAEHENPDIWLPIFYDFEGAQDHQESRFVALKAEDVDPERHFPLKTFLDPVAFTNANRQLSDERLAEIAGVQQIFATTLIPVQTFESEDKTSVAIVFERVNRLGVELNMFQLLTAWTWSEEFDLQDEFASLASEFENFGFADVGSDDDLMLRCCSAILLGDPSPAALIGVNGAEVRADFDRVKKALRAAIDFLRQNLHVRHVKHLPYTAMLIPLAAFYSKRQNESITDAERKTLLRWFWRTAFSHRYSGNPSRNIKADVQSAMALRDGTPWDLDHLSPRVLPDFFLSNEFRASTVASKTLILLLVRRGPRSFLSGEQLNLDEVLAEPNAKEIHHCFPRAYLIKSGIEDDLTAINSLANMAIISRGDNRAISAKAPSKYRPLMPDDISEIAASALLPNELFADDWGGYRRARADLLASDAMSLTA